MSRQNSPQLQSESVCRITRFGLLWRRKMRSDDNSQKCDWGH